MPTPYLPRGMRRRGRTNGAKVARPVEATAARLLGLHRPGGQLCRRRGSVLLLFVTPIEPAAALEGWAIFAEAPSGGPSPLISDGLTVWSRTSDPSQRARQPDTSPPE